MRPSTALCFTPQNSVLLVQLGYGGFRKRGAMQKYPSSAFWSPAVGNIGDEPETLPEVALATWASSGVQEFLDG